MKEQLEQRLAALEAEFAQAQKLKAEKEQELQNLTTTMLRIEGAIQVLKEELSQFSG